MLGGVARWCRRRTAGWGRGEMHARTRSGAAQGMEPMKITAEDLTEGLSACELKDRVHAERNEDLLRQHFPQVDKVVELAQEQLKSVLMLDLCPHFELANLLRANSDGPIDETTLIQNTFACEVRPLWSIRAAQCASSWPSPPHSVRR